MAHVDAGKTTTTERILYYSGTKHKVGDVDDGDTTTDFDPLERQKGITINSAAVSIDWGDNAASTSSTPPATWTSRPRSSGRLRVLDGAVGVFCAVGGVEVQSRNRLAAGQQVQGAAPRLRQQARPHGRRLLGLRRADEGRSCTSTPAIVTIPGRAGRRRSKGIIDLIDMKFITRDDDRQDATGSSSSTDIPEKYQDEAEKRREQMLDSVSAASDEITELILEGKQVPEDLIRKALCARGRSRARSRPIHCGSPQDVPRRAATARPRRRLPAQPARPAAGRRASHPKTKEAVDAQAGPEGADVGAGVQDRRRADRRPRVHPRLLRRTEAGRDVH